MRLKYVMPLMMAGCLLAGAEEIVTRAYNIGFLVRAPKDSAGPKLGFANGGGSGLGTEQEGGLTPELLAELIRQNIDPGLWDKRLLNLQGNNLLIGAPKDTHQRIKALLAHLRAVRATTLRLALRVYEGPEAAGAKLLGGGPLLDARSLAALEAKPWRLVRSGRLVAFSGQRVNLASTRHLRFVQDLDVDVAQDSSVSAPQMGRLTLGAVSDLRPVISSDGEGLLVECRMASARLDRIGKFDTGLEVNGLKPGGGGSLSAIEQPEVATRKVRCTVFLPAGGATLLGASGVGEKMRLLVLRHLRRPAGKVPPLPRGSARRSLRLFDTRFLLFEPSDFPGPNLAPTAPAGGAGGAAFAEDADEGVQLTTQELVEMIKSGVDEDSWHNTRNVINGTAAGVLVRQTPGTLQKVGAMFDRLARARQVSVMVRARYFAVSGGRDWFVQQAGSALDARQLAELERRVGTDDVKSAASLAVSGLPRQRVHAAALRTVPYVSGYDSVVAQGAGSLDPLTRRLTTGAVLDVTSVLVGDGERVMVELRHSLAELQEVRLVNVTPKVRLQVPELRLSGRSASLVIADGGAYLQALGGDRYALVQVSIGRPAAKGAEKKK